MNVQRKKAGDPVLEINIIKKKRRIEKKVILIKIIENRKIAVRLEVLHREVFLIVHKAVRLAIKKNEFIFIQ